MAHSKFPGSKKLELLAFNIRFTGFQGLASFNCSSNNKNVKKHKKTLKKKLRFKLKLKMVILKTPWLHAMDRINERKEFWLHMTMEKVCFCSAMIKNYRFIQIS